MLVSGVTLIEMVVSLLIITIVILTFIGTFQNITKTLFSSKSKMLATNLAQEGIQIRKREVFHKILVTTSPVYMTEFTPAVPYDPGNYPPERILEGGIYFERSYYIQRVQEIDGNLVYMPPTADDTGMKSITVNVTWEEGGRKKIVKIQNLVSNLDFTALIGQINGVVRNSVTNLPISNAMIVVAENVGWQDTTDTQGRYSISLLPGNYYLYIIASGYFPQTRSVSVGANPVTQDFSLVPRLSGTVGGNVWINDHIVISQVVASTVTSSGEEYEYLELYNPTTFHWVMSDGVSPRTGVKVWYPGEVSPTTVPIQYLTLTIPPSSYYLISNVSSMTIFGKVVFSDAIFLTENVIRCRDDVTKD
ncbi:MAG: carboxypeptidase regulatory-like domain-containing protein, partial [Endomicrobiia bacterium]